MRAALSADSGLHLGDEPLLALAAVDDSVEDAVCVRVWLCVICPCEHYGWGSEPEWMRLRAVAQCSLTRASLREKGCCVR